MSESEIKELARKIAYRYFDQAFDADPETLINIVQEEVRDAVKGGR